ncbi:MAG: hemagluttinin repeat-containing protein [Bacteroidetes bacterium]|nr:hemagluttinin repeat-containing protein [Bacteroidota bacterium]
MKQIYLKTIAVLLVIVSFNKLHALDYYLKSGTGSVILPAQWGPNPDGSGTSPANFSGSHVWHFTNRASASLTGIWSAAGTSTAMIETGFHLTVSGPGTMNTKIDVAANATISIANNKTYNLNNLDVDSYVRYNSGVAQVRPANYGNVVIATSTSLNGALGTGPIWIYGSLIINTSQVLTMNGYGVTLNGYNGSVSGAGTITGDAAAYIELIGGSGGNNGTLNFTGGAETLNYLYVQYDNAADYITLGTDLTITGGFFLQVLGGVDLNDNTLIVDNTSDASFAPTAADGVIMGSSTSALHLQGTIGLNSGTFDLFMDPSNNSLKCLNINLPGQVLSVGNALQIMDSLSVQDGDLTTNGNVSLMSTSALKGRLGKMGATATITGNLNVRTFALGGSTGWAQLGASGIDNLTFNDWYNYIPMAIEGSATGVTSAGGYYFESVQGWTESDVNGYDTLITVNSPITIGKGYWVYLGNGASVTTDMTWDVTGTPFTGPTTIPVTFNAGAQAGFNLIANPYPSPISWSALHNGMAGVNDAVYIYNADGPYASFVGGVGTNGGSDVIAMGQGFYVEATANTALTVTEDIKSSGNTVQLLRTTSASTPSTGLVFKLKLNGPFSDYDETAFRFHSQATANYDKGFDAKKMFQTPGYAGYPGSYSKYTSISSKDANNGDYSINSTPELMGQSVSIPVLVKVISSGSYTINPINLSNFLNPSCVVLKDKLLNINHNLANGAYVFNINDTTSTARFELNICGQNMPTSISNNSNPTNNVLISQDTKGPFVVTSFEQNTKAVISAYNILGQKIMNDVPVQGTEVTTYLNLPVHNQAVLIRVTTDKESTVKKMVIH